MQLRRRNCVFSVPPVMGHPVYKIFRAYIRMMYKTCICTRESNKIIIRAMCLRQKFLFSQKQKRKDSVYKWIVHIPTHLPLSFIILFFNLDWGWGRGCKKALTLTRSKTGSTPYSRSSAGNRECDRLWLVGSHWPPFHVIQCSWHRCRMRRVVCKVDWAHLSMDLRFTRTRSWGSRRSEEITLITDENVTTTNLQRALSRGWLRRFTSYQAHWDKYRETCIQRH